MLKQGREVRTNISELFRTSYGTVDITRLKSVFLNLSSWVEPIEELERWESIINTFKTKVKKSIQHKLPTTPFKSNVIVDLDLRASGIRVGKRSFMRCEVTLFLENNKKIKDLKSKELINSMDNLTNDIVSKSFLKSNTFTFYKSKK
tara:strand:- start:1756 stop:2196 length:441 start_codon:yes stop_codon:yes gene_type:complete